MANPIQTQTITLGDKEIIIETGRYAPQTAGTATVRCGDTIVIASAVTAGDKEGLDFFPLTVEYREKHYAGGVISSSRFIKREGRPSDNEILTSRLIDRSIRPFFPKGFKNEVQVIINPLSIDGVNEPEILGIIAASAALSVSGIPFEGPVGAVRVGFNEKLIVNPSLEEKTLSTLDLVISGTKDSIAMVEAGSLEVTEETVLNALKFGQEQLGHIIAGISKLEGKEKVKFVAPEYDELVVKLVNEKIDINEVLKQSKTVSGEGIKLAPLVELVAGDNEEVDRIQIAELIDEKIKVRIREMIMGDGIRFDDRKATDIREITAEVGLLPRTHGSGYFKRGLTHVLSIATLGSPADEQLIDGMKGEETKRYMHHYNMGPVATGEPGRFGNPGRREIGHGALA